MSPPPTPSVRAHLGTVGVAAGQFTPAASLVGPPTGRGAGAEWGAGAGLKYGASVGMMLGLMSGGLAIPLTIPAGAIIGAPIGAVVGASRAEPAADLQAKQVALETAFADLGPQLHTMLRERVVVLGRDRASRALRPLPDHGPSAVIERVDYRALAAREVTTVLEVRVVGFGLFGEPGIRPPVSCLLAIRTRLVRTSDGRTLYEATMAYRGPTRPLDEWLADGAAPFREEARAAVGWSAEQIVDQVFLRVASPEGVLRVRVKPATLGDVEARLLGDDGLFRGLQRFDAEFDGLALRADEGQRLRAFLPEIARAPWDSELTLEGTIDGAPFTIKMERDDEGCVSGSLEGLVFDSSGRARDFIASFVPTAKLTLDGYAGGRRIRVTLEPEGVAPADRGAGVPAHETEETEPDDALEVRVLPATLEDARERLLGERGLVTRGQRFEAEFEKLALAVEDVEPLVDLLRAALGARPRSELELDGTLEGLPFEAKLAIDRKGRARLVLEGFVFASEQDVDRFLARFENADAPLEMTVVGLVAGQKVRRTRQLGSAAARSSRLAPPKDALRVRVRPATLGDVETRLLGEAGLLRGPRRFDAEFEGLALRAEEGTRLRALLQEIARAPRDSELTLEGALDGAPFTINVEKDERGRVSGSLEGLVFDHPGEARNFVASFVPAGPTAKLSLDGYAGAAGST